MIDLARSLVERIGVGAGRAMSDEELSRAVERLVASEGSPA